jgi:hypothetical protein
MNVRNFLYLHVFSGYRLQLPISVPRSPGISNFSSGDRQATEHVP